MDIALLFDSSRLRADLALAGPDLARDNTLSTAVIISLFTDRRAHPDDRLPDDTTGIAGGGSPGGGDRRGWWGDWYPGDAVPAANAGSAVLQPPADRIGSRLWLLSREKQLPEVLRRAKEYVEEALAWMIEDKAARAIDVTAEISAPGVLGLSIRIVQPDAARQTFQFQYAWGGL